MIRPWEIHTPNPQALIVHIHYQFQDQPQSRTFSGSIKYSFPNELSFSFPPKKEDYIKNFTGEKVAAAFSNSAVHR